MEGRDGRKRLGRLAGMAAAAALAFDPAVVRAGGDAPNVRLSHNSQRFAVSRAVGGAVQKLALPSCQALLDEFADASGRPLRANLDALGLSAPEYVQRIFFYDGPARLCGTSGLAVTTPGSRAVFVCGARFVREMSSNDRHAEATIIHEMLHSLGLGENPPSSDYINARVLARCGQSGEETARRATAPAHGREAGTVAAE